ncbi:APEX2 [Bugula neritina]|uniref:exodeoxyribonuclease III n=1 Tax=Bugula neritina TaxID=10212 RepID=A0A7J7JJ90_BUGNE|nr:APEX2 [Bugula neritina]
MKIVSWNVNGLRSLKKKIGVIITELEADVACFQETKITKELMTEELAIVDGYRSYFSYSRARAGYSGVVIYCRRGLQPEHATDSLITKLDSEDDLSFSLPADTLKCLDNEGRTLIAQFRLQDEGKEKSLLTLINLYCPCVTGETEGRELFRLQFLQTLEERIKQLQKISYVIVLGDINISHKVIDSCDPGDTEEFLSQPHRQWLDKMLTPGPGALIDTYRVLHPCTKYAYTCWNTKLNARQTNFGTRIDYILLDGRLREHLKSAEVMAKYMGSDHCPVQAEITNINVKPSVKPRLSVVATYLRLNNRS